MFVASSPCHLLPRRGKMCGLGPLHIRLRRRRFVCLAIDYKRRAGSAGAGSVWGVPILGIAGTKSYADHRRWPPLGPKSTRSSAHRPDILQINVADWVQVSWPL